MEAGLFGLHILSSNPPQLLALGQEDTRQRAHASARARPLCKQWAERAMLAVTDLTDLWVFTRVENRVSLLNRVAHRRLIGLFQTLSA